MPYTQTTQQQLAQAILVAMQDPTGVFWQFDEVVRAIDEGMLLWGALTSAWRERGTFTATVGAAGYDLSVQLPTLRARTYTFDQLVKEIQYHLMELPGGVAGTGMTSQFSVQQIVLALTRKRNELVLDTRLPLSTGPNSFPISPSPSGRTSLPENVTLIARASWTDGTSGVVTPLRREDAWSEDAYSPLWTLNPGTPIAYSTAETRPIEIQLYPAPISSGLLNLLYVNTIALDGLAATKFQVPDEFVHAIKWGALYSILASQNEGYDPLRAQYAKARYDQAVQMSTLMRSVIRVQVNDVPVQLDTVVNLDASNQFWQNQQGTPTIAGCLYDFIALSKVPDKTYGVTCDVVRSAPIPPTIGDIVQLGAEEMSYLVGYVRHILSFKLGGNEFQATMPLYDSFLSGATQRNKLLSAKARYLTPLFGQPASQEDIYHAA